MTGSLLLPRSIVIVRHGETDWNVGQRIQGRTEVPLNDTGRAQAREAAGLLGSGAWTRVVSSPLGRAVETGGIIANSLGLAEPSIDPELLERDFGPAEGLLVADANERWPALDVPDAETLDELAERGVSAFTRLLREAPGSIVVAHGALMRSALSALSGTASPRILNGEAWEVGSAESDGLRVVRLGAPAAQHAV